jgi:hypothetical protein
MQNLTIAELDAQSVELLPAKETLFWNDWAAVYATNSSAAVNAATVASAAYSAAVQTIVISQ